MNCLSTLEKKNKPTTVPGRKCRTKKEETILPKLNTAQTAPARIGNLTETKRGQDFTKDKFSKRRPSKLLFPLSGLEERTERLRTPSCSTPSDSNVDSSDYDESQYSEITEFSEMQSGFLETLNKEVSKRVISGMVLTTKCGDRAQNISQKSLGKRVERFLGRSAPASVISPRPPRPPRVLTPLPPPRQKRDDIWCQRQQQISNVLSNSLRAMYTDKNHKGKCRYMRAPLTPIPSIDWVFEHCGKVERIVSATNS